MGDKETLRTFIDDAYSYICVCCPVDSSRHGPKVTGQREIYIRKCKKHENTKGIRDEDLERLAKRAWTIDPHPEKYLRYKKTVPGSGKPGRPREY